MTKEEWNTVKNQTEWPITLFYEYFLEKGGSSVGLMRFQQEFTKACIEEPVFRKPDAAGVMKDRKVNFGTSIYRVYKHYEQKFAA